MADDKVHHWRHGWIPIPGDEVSIVGGDLKGTTGTVKVGPRDLSAGRVKHVRVLTNEALNRRVEVPVDHLEPKNKPVRAAGSWEEQRHPRDTKGRFRRLAAILADMEKVAALSHVSSGDTATVRSIKDAAMHGDRPTALRLTTTLEQNSGNIALRGLAGEAKDRLKSLKVSKNTTKVEPGSTGDKQVVTHPDHGEIGHIQKVIHQTHITGRTNISQGTVNDTRYKSVPNDGDKHTDREFKTQREALHHLAERADATALADGIDTERTNGHDLESGQHIINPKTGEIVTVDKVEKVGLGTQIHVKDKNGDDHVIRYDSYHDGPIDRIKGDLPGTNAEPGQGDQRGEGGAGPALPELPHFNKVSVEGRPDGAGTEADPIAVGDDLDRAVALLSEGKHVRLDQQHQVSTLLDKLAAHVEAIKAGGGEAPEINLCQISVPGTNLFCAEHKGIERTKMPQLSGHPEPNSPAEAYVNAKGEADITEPFIRALQERGISITEKRVPAAHLKASQMELDGPKVVGIAGAMDAGKVPEAPIFVTRDGYIIDGHHRWAANVTRDLRGLQEGDDLGNVQMPVRELDMDIGAALDFTNAFALDMGIRPKGLGKGAEGVTEPADLPHTPGGGIKHTDAPGVHMDTPDGPANPFATAGPERRAAAPKPTTRFDNGDAYWRDQKAADKYLNDFKPGDSVIVTDEQGKEHQATISRTYRDEGRNQVKASLGPGRYTFDVNADRLAAGTMGIRKADAPGDNGPALAPGPAGVHPSLLPGNIAPQGAPPTDPHGFGRDAAAADAVDALKDVDGNLDVDSDTAVPNAIGIVQGDVDPKDLSHGELLDVSHAIHEAGQDLPGTPHRAVLDAAQMRVAEEMDRRQARNVQGSRPVGDAPRSMPDSGMGGPVGDILNRQAANKPMPASDDPNEIDDLAADGSTTAYDLGYDAHTSEGEAANAVFEAITGKDGTAQEKVEAGIEEARAIHESDPMGDEGSLAVLRSVLHSDGAKAEDLLAGSGSDATPVGGPGGPGGSHPALPELDRLQTEWDGHAQEVVGDSKDEDAMRGGIEALDSLDSRLKSDPNVDVQTAIDDLRLGTGDDERDFTGEGPHYEEGWGDALDEAAQRLGGGDIQREPRGGLDPEPGANYDGLEEDTLDNLVSGLDDLISAEQDDPEMGGRYIDDVETVMHKIEDREPLTAHEAAIAADALQSVIEDWENNPDPERDDLDETRLNAMRTGLENIKAGELGAVPEADPSRYEFSGRSMGSNLDGDTPVTDPDRWYQASAISQEELRSYQDLNEEDSSDESIVDGGPDPAIDGYIEDLQNAMDDSNVEEMRRLNSELPSFLALAGYADDGEDDFGQWREDVHKALHGPDERVTGVPSSPDQPGVRAEALKPGDRILHPQTGEPVTVRSVDTRGQRVNRNTAVSLEHADGRRSMIDSDPNRVHTLAPDAPTGGGDALPPGITGDREHLRSVADRLRGGEDLYSHLRSDDAPSTSGGAPDPADDAATWDVNGDNYQEITGRVTPGDLIRSNTDNKVYRVTNAEGLAFDAEAPDGTSRRFHAGDFDKVRSKEDAKQAEIQRRIEHNRGVDAARAERDDLRAQVKGGRSAKMQRAFRAASDGDHGWLRAHGIETTDGATIYASDQHNQIGVKVPGDEETSWYKVNGNGQGLNLGKIAAPGDDVRTVHDGSVSTGAAPADLGGEAERQAMRDQVSALRTGRSAKAQRAFTAAEQNDTQWLASHGFNAHPDSEVWVDDTNNRIALRQADGTWTAHGVNGNGQATAPSFVGKGQIPAEGSGDLPEGFRKPDGTGPQASDRNRTGRTPKPDEVPLTEEERYAERQHPPTVKDSPTMPDGRPRSRLGDGPDPSTYGQFDYTPTEPRVINGQDLEPGDVFKIRSIKTKNSTVSRPPSNPDAIHHTWDGGDYSNAGDPSYETQGQKGAVKMFGLGTKVEVIGKVAPQGGADQPRVKDPMDVIDDGHTHKLIGRGKGGHFRHRHEGGAFTHEHAQQGYGMSKGQPVATGRISGETVQGAEANKVGGETTRTPVPTSDPARVTRLLPTIESDRRRLKNSQAVVRRVHNKPLAQRSREDMAAYRHHKGIIDHFNETGSVHPGGGTGPKA